MSRPGNLIEPRESAASWLPALVVAGLFHAGILAAGFTSERPDHFDEITLGEQAANDPPAPAGEFLEVEWAPDPIVPEPAIEPITEPVVEQEIPPEPEPEPLPEPEPEPIPEPAAAEPPPVAEPEFVEPVKPPEPPAPVQETPKPPPPAPKPKPQPPAPKPKPPVARSTPAPRPAARPAAVAGGTGPATSTGTNPRGQGNPNFAPSDLVVGNKNFPRPPYPAEARRQRLEGAVTFNIRVSGGKVTGVTVVRSSGHAVLDSSASRFIRANWKFPAGVTRTFTQRLQFGIAR